MLTLPSVAESEVGTNANPDHNSSPINDEGKDGPESFGHHPADFDPDVFKPTWFASRHVEILLCLGFEWLPIQEELFGSFLVGIEEGATGYLGHETLTSLVP